VLIVLDCGGFGEFGESLHSRPVTGSGPDLRGGGANWAVAQGPPQLRGLHKKNSKKLLPKET